MFLCLFFNLGVSSRFPLSEAPFACVVPYVSRADFCCCCYKQTITGRPNIYTGEVNLIQRRCQNGGSRSVFFLKPPPRRFRAGAARHALLVASAHLQPLLRSERELAIQLGGRVLPMDEIAEAAPHTALAGVESAAGLPEVRHGAQLAVDRPPRVPAAVQLVAGPLRRVLVLEARVHVPDQVVVGVVADHELFQLAVLAQLAP